MAGKIYPCPDVHSQSYPQLLWIRGPRAEPLIRCGTVKHDREPEGSLETLVAGGIEDYTPRPFEPTTPGPIYGRSVTA